MGKYNTHVNAEHEEDKSIFTPPTMTATTQSDLSKSVSRRDAEQTYSKSPLCTKLTTSTMIIPAAELMSRLTTIVAILSSKDGNIINKHSQHGLLTPDSSQSVREDGGIIRTLMNTEPSMESVQVSSICIFIFM